jgi:4-nitrophenyl phosphatase
MLLKDRFPQVKGLIFDMDGVLWRDNTPLLDLKRFFNTLTNHGYQFVLATNNATRNTAQYQEKLLSFGVNLTPQQIINSPMATAYYLQKKFPQGGPVYIVGEYGLVSTLAEKGFYQSETNVLAVVAGLDLHITYEKLKIATLLIRSGVPFIGTNPDKTYPSPKGLVPGAGSILAAIEAATDVKPVTIGKPEPTMMEMALLEMGTSPSTTMVVGDRLDTDILAGQNSGCLTTLVMTGVSTQDELNNWHPEPDMVLANAEMMIE